MKPDNSINVLGNALTVCSNNPKTGFFRDGHCNTCDADQGSHTVCAVMTAEFLAFSKYVGNDLSTPRPEFGFPGLNPRGSLVFVRRSVPASGGRRVRPQGATGRDAYAGAGHRSTGCAAGPCAGRRHRLSLRRIKLGKGPHARNTGALN